METIIEKIAKYDNCVQGLIDKLNEYEAKVKKYVPIEFWPNFGLKKFFRNSQWEKSFLQIDGCMMPNYAGQCGTYHYWANDFNCAYRIASRKQVVELAKSLPEKLKAFEVLLSKLQSEAETA